MQVLGNTSASRVDGFTSKIAGQSKLTAKTVAVAGDFFTFLKEHGAEFQECSLQIKAATAQTAIEDRLTEGMKWGYWRKCGSYLKNICTFRGVGSSPHLLFRVLPRKAKQEYLHRLNQDVNLAIIASESDEINQYKGLVEALESEVKHVYLEEVQYSQATETITSEYEFEPTCLDFVNNRVAALCCFGERSREFQKPDLEEEAVLFGVVDMMISKVEDPFLRSSKDFDGWYGASIKDPASYYCQAQEKLSVQALDALTHAQCVLREGGDQTSAERTIPVELFRETEELMRTCLTWKDFSLIIEAITMLQVNDNSEEGGVSDEFFDLVKAAKERLSQTTQPWNDSEESEASD